MSVTPEEQVAYLRSLPSVREGCHRVLAIGEADALPSFAVRSDKLPALADYVVQVIRDFFPAGEGTVPFHSRWVLLCD
jgi:hypothetical protein